MTDQSKTQRKRRLQLNAEEFAPPSNLYDTSEEPRLDDAWVKFYGGETRGGIKRLSELDLDEATPAPQTDETAADATAETASPRLQEAARTETQPTAEIETEPETETESETETEPFNLYPAPSVISAPTSDVPAASPSVNAAPPFSQENRPAEPASEGPRLAPLPHVREFPREAAPHAPEQTPTEPAASAEIRQKRPYKRRKPYRKPVRTRRLRTPLPLAADFQTPSFEEWAERWSPWIKHRGVIKVGRAFFELTYAKGLAECFTTNAVIMSMTGLSRAQCIRNTHYLIELGFLDKLEEMNNKEAKGNYYRFNLVPPHLNHSEI